MSPAFRLATVERLRATELEHRGRELAAVSADLGRARDARAAIEGALAAPVPGVSDPGAFTRQAVYRERLRVDLAAATAEIGRCETLVTEARAAWLDARGKLKAVESLHERHRSAVRAERARRDQAELDDLAGTRRRGEPAGVGGGPS